MRKTLRFLLLSLLVMICGVSFAQTTETFDWSGITTTTTAKEDNVYKQGDITLTFSKGENSYGNIPSENKEGAIRMYVATHLKIKVAEGYLIQNVNFTPTSKTYSATNLTYNEVAISDDWTLSEPVNEVLLVATANARFKKISITYIVNDPTAVATPSIEGVDKFETTADVTITGAEGTTIYYTTDGTEPTTSSVNTGASPVKFTVSETTTVKAIAAKDGKVSAVAEKTFTKVAYRKYVKATAVEAGKSYLIVSGGKVALPISGNYGYLYVVDGSETNGVISQETADNEFTFEAVNGGYKIKQQNGKYLYMKGTYNSFNVGAETTENDVWTVTANADGTFKIENVGMTKYIQYSTQYISYGCYADVQGDMPYLYVIDDTATGINSVESNVNNSNAIYNMAGQRLQKLQKGLNIVGGKKVVVK